jgi:predicted XRE-type DNA-binding protein
MTKSAGTNAIPGQVFADAWDALEDSPSEAANMRLRSELMMAIQQAVQEWSTTQANAARRLDVTQPRLNDLLRGRINNFSLDALTVLAARAGLNVRLHVAPAAA